jgi:DNA replication protein DnaD
LQKILASNALKKEKEKKQEPEESPKYVEKFLSYGGIALITLLMGYTIYKLAMHIKNTSTPPKQ